jgi:hypothetical protein
MVLLGIAALLQQDRRPPLSDPPGVSASGTWIMAERRQSQVVGGSRALRTRFVLPPFSYHDGTHLGDRAGRGTPFELRCGLRSRNFSVPFRVSVRVDYASTRIRNARRELFGPPRVPLEPC